MCYSFMEKKVLLSLAYIFTSTAPRLPKLYAFLVMAVKLLSTKIVGNTSMLPTGQTKEGTDKNVFLVSSSWCYAFLFSWVLVFWGVWFCCCCFLWGVLVWFGFGGWGPGELCKTLFALSSVLSVQLSSFEFQVAWDRQVNISC